MIMKRCFKCVSSQKCSTGNLQSVRGRCEMCSPCHFCHDRSTVRALRCQIPPPSRCSNTHALDGSVRKPRERPGALGQPAPIALLTTPKKSPLADHRKDSLIIIFFFLNAVGGSWGGHPDSHGLRDDRLCALGGTH